MRTGVLLAAFIVLAAAMPNAQAALTVAVNGAQGNYIPGGALNGTVTVLFDQDPGNAQLAVYVDNSVAPVAALQLQSLIAAASPQYESVPLTYELKANGKNAWTEYPILTFTYGYGASGTCGGDYCASGGTNFCYVEGSPISCPAVPSSCKNGPYPCSWSYSQAPSTSITGSISAKDGLKFIANVSKSLNVPFFHNNDTFWTVQETSSSVQLTMRQACGTPSGTQKYYNFPVWDDGWMRRSLTELKGPAAKTIPGTSHRTISIEPFDNGSLQLYPTLFNGGPGGVYRNQQKQAFYKWTPGTTAPDGTVFWDGQNVTVFNYVDTAVYEIVYLPPNGPSLCAFTSSTQPNQSLWTVGKNLTVSLDFAHPYSVEYTNASLAAAVGPYPNCPSYATDCTASVLSTSASKKSDPTGTVTFSYVPAAMKATATTTWEQLTSTFATPAVQLKDFAGLTVPNQQGNHTLTFAVLVAGEQIASAMLNITTCTDNDGDGFCNAVDCNDSNPEINPDATETCNGVDQDCDGVIDNGFTILFASIGSACGDAGTCAGTVVCTADGANVTCSNTKKPGQTKEICDNKADDDCDGLTDEALELVNGQSGLGCFCEEGKVRGCGSNVGACSAGTQVCVNGQWTTCSGSVEPGTEICNNQDDDCDGVIDNVNGGTSKAATQCGCFNGAPPKTEVCNDIDDDCDGLAEDGITCCTPGQTRSCGLNVGACKPGVQVCTGEFHWAGDCSNAILPRASEVCYNGQDDTCDGETDENCIPELTCKNGHQDLNEEGVDCGPECGNICPWNIASTVLPAVVGLAVVLVAVFGLLPIIRAHRLASKRNKEWEDADKEKAEEDEEEE